MIVQCENCEARFKLNESLLKDGGSKVRCSKCKHVFIAYPPTEEPPIDLLPEDLLPEEESPAVKSPDDASQQEAFTEEKPPDGESLGEEATALDESLEEEPSPVDERLGEALPDEEQPEEDISDEEETPPGPAAESREETVILDSPLDMDDLEDRTEDQLAPGTEGVDDKGIEVSLDDDLDFSLDEELEGAELDGLDKEIDALSAEEFGDSDAMETDEAVSSTQEPPGADDLEGEIDALSAEEIPGAEDLDAGTGEEIKTLSPEDIPDEDDLLSDMDEEVKPAGVVRGEKAGAGQGAVVEEEISAEAPEVEERPVKKRKRSLLLPIIVLILLLLVGGVAAVYFLAPQFLPDSMGFLKPGADQEVSDPGVRRLNFEKVKGYFIAAENGKKRFVVRGEVINNYSMARSYVLIKAAILDSKGNPVVDRAAYAGNEFSQGELRATAMEELISRMKTREGANKKNVNVPPGGKLPFMAVFEDLPEDISEFTVEAVSSAPGKR